MSADFIDSNVFIYLLDETEANKAETARGIIRTALETGSGLISFQVVQETLNVVTRKLKTPLTNEHAQRFAARFLFPLWQVMPSQRLYQRGLDLQTRYRYHFYDALIIAAALEAGCRRLYSEDMQHGQRIDGLSIENPFLPD